MYVGIPQPPRGYRIEWYDHGKHGLVSCVAKDSPERIIAADTCYPWNQHTMNQVMVRHCWAHKAAQDERSCVAGGAS